jgi:hypothetical protein
MFPQPAIEFQWISPLGVSVILFSLYGLLSLVVGMVLFIVFRNQNALPGSILFLSQQMDKQLFGRSTVDLHREDRSLATLYFLYINWLAGLFLSFGIFQLALAWFGLRSGQAWALWTITLADLVLVPYFMRIVRVYTSSGVNIQIAQLPPLYTLQVLIPVAALLGWLGLRAIETL